jgi:allophanate hydrolase subunit 1
MSERPRTTLTLRALRGQPLAEPLIRRTVVAAARGLAERHGLALVDVRTTSRSITVTLDASKIAALGFMAELRRATERWHEGRTGEAHLWGDPDEGDASEDDDGDDDGLDLFDSRFGLF